MPQPLQPTLRRPTSRSIRAPELPPRPRGRVRPPWIAVLPLAVGFFGALGVDEFLDQVRAAQLTSPPQAEMSDEASVSPPAPIAAAVEQSPTVAPPATPPPPREVARSGSTTREPDIERKLDRVLEDGRTPYAATVLIEIGTGRVIAVAEHSTRGPSDGLASKPIAPAASIFKLVTTSALLQSGVASSTKVCTHGGKTRMSPKLLVDNPKRDGQCATFADVVPQSLNVAIAKLALKHLDPERLRAEAARWGFGTAHADDMKPSIANIPDDPFAFANAAAGFGDVKISALHGAMIAAAAVQDGLLIAPRFDDAADVAAPTRAMPVDVARQLRAMMVDTVAEGTGRRSFSQAPRLNVSAGGKTGSLADYDTGLDTSWFVGFAPADKPRVAVASVVVNTAKWHVKAPVVAKEALRAYFAAHPVDAGRNLVARR
jgi:peptidoglycan glycosyltransferase